MTSPSHIPFGTKLVVSPAIATGLIAIEIGKQLEYRPCCDRKDLYQIGFTPDIIDRFYDAAMTIAQNDNLRTSRLPAKCPQSRREGRKGPGIDLPHPHRSCGDL